MKTGAAQKLKGAPHLKQFKRETRAAHWSGKEQR